jgi:hypothetical protein
MLQIRNKPAASWHAIALSFACALVAVAAVAALAQSSAPATAELVSTRKIWDRAPHSALADLVHLRDRWYLVFREGSAADSPGGAIRVLSSLDGERWDPWARLDHPVADLRNPRLSITPHDRLMLTANGVISAASESPHKTYVWLSTAGREWEGPHQAGANGDWISGVAWNRGKAYGLGFDAASAPAGRTLHAYVSHDGTAFEMVNPEAGAGPGPAHNAVAFGTDNTALALLAREGEAKAQLGASRPPYRHWAWRDLDVRLGGPRMVSLGDGRVVVSGAVLNDEKAPPHLALLLLDPAEATLREVLSLPSTSSPGHAGMVYDDGLLWIAYDAVDEAGRNSIYLAQVRLP